MEKKKTAVAASPLRFTCWYRRRTRLFPLFLNRWLLFASLNFHQHFVLYFEPASYILFFLGKDASKTTRAYVTIVIILHIINM